MEQYDSIIEAADVGIGQFSSGNGDAASDIAIYFVYDYDIIDNNLNITHACFICLRHLLQNSQLQLGANFVHELPSQFAINEQTFTSWHESNQHNFAGHRSFLLNLHRAIPKFFNESLPFASFVRNVIIGNNSRASDAEYKAIKSYIPSLSAASIVS